MKSVLVLFVLFILMVTGCTVPASLTDTGGNCLTLTPESENRYRLVSTFESITRHTILHSVRISCILLGYRVICETTTPLRLVVSRGRGEHQGKSLATITIFRRSKKQHTVTVESTRKKNSREITTKLNEVVGTRDPRFVSPLIFK